MKKIDKVVNNKGYLLGVIDNQWVYLEKPSWDCGWYWGFGYLHYHTRNARTWNTHTHFDSVFFNVSRYEKDEWNSKSAYDRLRTFERLTLTEKEMWKLLDYMKTFYTLKETAAVFGRGGSHFTSSANLEIIKSEDIAEHINKVMLPALFAEIDKLFTENTED